MIKIKLSNRATAIKPSATLAVGAKASALKAKGLDIISLALGEPDFPTPQHVKEAGVNAINSNKSYYTPVDGTPSLKQAIIEKFKRDNQLTYDASQIIVSTGAKQALYNAFQVVLNPEDEIIIPAPYWVSYIDIATLCEAKSVVIDTTPEQDYKITAAQLEAAITPHTKALLLNSPSNPTGMVYSKNELTAIADVLLKYPDITIISDDIYEQLYWANEPFYNIVMACPELYDRTIVINGVSKAYAMTGWRIGYAAGPTHVIKAMTTLQSQSTSNASAVAQYAAESALRGSQDCVHTMNQEYQKRQKLLLNGINQIPGLSCRPTQGAFYLFVNAENAIKQLGLADDLAFADYLLEKANIAVVPGSAFGAANHIRLSYASHEDILKQALTRLADCLKS